MDIKLLVNTIRDAGFEPTSYSGRGMYGRHCLGVVCPNHVSALIQIIQEYAWDAKTSDEVADFIEGLQDAKIDSMGLDTILYWPDIEWNGDDEDGDEGEPEEPWE